MKESTKRILAGVAMGVFISSCGMYREIPNETGRMILSVIITVCAVYLGLFISANYLEGEDDYD